MTSWCKPSLTTVGANLPAREEEGGTLLAGDGTTFSTELTLYSRNALLTLFPWSSMVPSRSVHTWDGGEGDGTPLLTTSLTNLLDNPPETPPSLLLRLEGDKNGCKRVKNGCKRGQERVHGTGFTRRGYGNGCCRRGSGIVSRHREETV